MSLCKETLRQEFIKSIGDSAPADLVFFLKLNISNREAVTIEAMVLIVHLSLAQDEDKQLWRKTF